MAILLVTKFVGPTDHRCARVSVSGPSGLRKFVPWEYAAGTEENHSSAAAACAAEWFGSGPGTALLGQSVTHCGKGYAFMFGKVSE